MSPGSACVPAALLHVCACVPGGFERGLSARASAGGVCDAAALRGSAGLQSGRASDPSRSPPDAAVRSAAAVLAGLSGRDGDRGGSGRDGVRCSGAAGTLRRRGSDRRDLPQHQSAGVPAAGVRLSEASHP